MKYGTLLLSIVLWSSHAMPMKQNDYHQTFHCWCIKNIDIPLINKTDATGAELAALYYNYDGSMLISIEKYSPFISIRNGLDGAKIRQIQYTDNIARAAINPCNNIIALASNYKNAVDLYDLDSGFKTRTMSIPHSSESIITALAFKQDGMHLASCSHEVHSTTDFSWLYEQGISIIAPTFIEVWNVSDGTKVCPHSFRAHAKPTHILGFMGDYLMSASDDCHLKFWDASTGSLIQDKAFSSNFSCLACSNHEAFSFGDNTGLLMGWGKERKSRTIQAHARSIRAVAFSDCGRILVSGSWDKTVKLWDAQFGHCLKTIDFDSRGVDRLALSSKNILAVALESGEIYLFDLSSLCEELGKTKHHEPYDCPICCEEMPCHVVTSFQEITILACGHTYHKGCVDQWLDRSRTCPECRVCVEKR